MCGEGSRGCVCVWVRVRLLGLCVCGEGPSVSYLVLSADCLKLCLDLNYYTATAVRKVKIEYRIRSECRLFKVIS